MTTCIVDPARIPRHIAIIMDGNGRWATARGWARWRGHAHGADTVRRITTESAALGVRRLTLFAFSSENWARPAVEVAALMDLLVRFLEREVPTMQEHGVRLAAIGQLDRLPRAVREALARTIAATADGQRMVLSLALSYGGRDELTDACRAIAAEVAGGRRRLDEITSGTLAQHLYGGPCPFGADDVDLLIRTAGERRTSGFLPWQATYAEFVSSAVHWPEFSVADFHACLAEFQGRERRFGKVA